MLRSTTLTALAGAGLLILATSSFQAFGQGMPQATPPVATQATKAQTDAAKQAMDAERRRRLEEEEKAKAAAQKK